MEKCSRKAFSLLPDVQAAIAELSTLKGVGPATASGEHGVGREAESPRRHVDTARLLKATLIAFLLRVRAKQLGPTALCINSSYSLHGCTQLGPGLTVHFVPAVLVAGAPEQTAFMSDEAMESVPGLRPIQYTSKHYALYLDQMVEKTEKLNKGKINNGRCTVLVFFLVLGVEGAF